MVNGQMFILALDFGLKRIGVAVGSTDTGMAFPRDPIANDEHTFDHIGATVPNDRIGKILVGNPLKRDGAPGDIDEALRQFRAELKIRFGIPVELVDERYTSKIASQMLARSGITAKAGKKLQDSIAAQVILEGYLQATS